MCNADGRLVLSTKQSFLVVFLIQIPTCNINAVVSWDCLDFAGAGAVHKSPFASEETPRLLLTLDEALPHSCPDC